MNLTKSKYCMGIQCEKLLWLQQNKSEEANYTNDVVFENGNKVGELARELFGDYSLVCYDDLGKMIDDTKKKLANKTSIICEASFCYDGNFCAVDILKNDDDGVEIYEVKSSTKINDIYIQDLTYQTWILKKCGIHVKGSFLVYVNGNYIKNGDINIQEYFKIEDLTNDLYFEGIEERIKEYSNVLQLSIEPNIDLSMFCHKPYTCPFFSYCIRKLPTPNVFDIGWNTHFDKKIELYQNGLIRYEEILKHGGISPKADTQMKFNLHNYEAKINKKAIENFLDTLSYPLYFLDFESFQEAIPTIDGTRPYQQICFQYSLHYYLKDGGDILHKEYLSDDYMGNPMYGLCRQLCEDIPKNSCVIVYNQSFEKTRLTEMANLFSEFHDHLLNIRDNIVDLAIPFKNQDYYVKEMGGSFSIKKVLLALFPDDASLDYHNLAQVHKGDEASNAYLALKDLDIKERNVLRNNLLKYCELDTYAMVKILEKILKVCKGEKNE